MAVSGALVNGTISGISSAVDGEGFGPDSLTVLLMDLCLEQ